MEADILCTVGERNDCNFFGFCQLYIVVWSFQFWNVSSELEPDVGGEGYESFAAGKFDARAIFPIQLQTDP